MRTVTDLHVKYHLLRANHPNNLPDEVLVQLRVKGLICLGEDIYI